MLETCWTRKDKLYAQGYKDALDDVLRGALNIQNTFNVHYTIRDKSPEGVYKEMEEHDKERY